MAIIHEAWSIVNTFFEIDHFLFTLHKSAHDLLTNFTVRGIMLLESEVLFFMEFYEILKDLRKKHYLSQGELAKALNISKSAISMYELDKRKPDIDMIVKIATHFNVDANYLLGLGSKTRVLSSLTPHETQVITAYRDQPDMQPAVDKLLGVTMDGYVTVYAAANSESNHKHTITRIPQDKWNEIENEPNTDEDLL